MRRAKRARTHPGTVLLIGSDSIVSRALQLYLHKEGYDTMVLLGEADVWRFELGSVRLHGVRRQPPVQLAMLMPGVDRVGRAALCRHLHASPVTRAAPVLALLDAGDVREAHDTRDAGEARDGSNVDATIVWPFRLREVLEEIETLLARRPSAIPA